MPMIAAEVIGRAKGKALGVQSLPKEVVPILVFIVDPSPDVSVCPVLESETHAGDKTAVIVVGGAGKVEIDDANTRQELAVRMEVAEVAPCIDHSASRRGFAKVGGLR